MKPCHPLCIFSEGSEKKVNAKLMQYFSVEKGGIS